MKILEACLVNVAIHPHSKGLYLDLFAETFRLGQVVKLRGNEWAMMGEIKPLVVDNYEKGFIGQLYCFLDTGKALEWFDLRTVEPLVIDGDSAESLIPDNLKPLLKKVGFIFYPDSHKLVVDTEHITPLVAQKFFRSLFSHSEIVDKFGEVLVNLVNKSETIDKILKMDVIVKLIIHVSRPNSDDLHGLEESVKRRIERERVRATTIVKNGDRKEGIAPDEETQAYMNISSENGYTTATGVVDGAKVTISTKSHPVLASYQFDDSQQNNLQALQAVSSELIAKY